MRTFLRSASVKGIKNIDKEVTINFTKLGEITEDELKDYNVKAIYGSNGSGKTAFLHGFKILKDINFDKNYLSLPSNQKFLSEIINKNCDVIKVKVDFFDLENRRNIREYYTHEIEIKENDDEFQISYEKYSKTNILTKNETIIYKSINGKEAQSKFPKEFKKFTINLLDKRPFLNIISESIQSENLSVMGDVELSYLITLLKLYNNMKIIMDPNDIHKTINIALGEEISNINKQKSIISKNLENLNRIKSNDKIVNDKTYKRLKQELPKQELFIKLFKPEVNGIKISKKTIINKDKSRIHLIEYYIMYSKYEVNLEYESVGIKKLFTLYDSIKALSKGEVLIVDELDVHVNDVYLNKLIEYVAKYTNGQLIFTSHNITPMDFLKDKKMAIDYITGDLTITPWVQRGNYSPANLYQKGMIKGLPFNIEPEDFLAVFDSHE